MTFQEELAEMLTKANEALEVNNVQLANDYMDKADKVKAKIAAEERLEAEKAEAEAKAKEAAAAIEAKAEQELIELANEIAMEAPQHIDLQMQATNEPLIEKETTNEMNELTMSRDALLASKEYHEAYWANIMLKATPEQIKMLDTGAGSAGAAVPQITLDRIQEILTKMGGVVAEADWMNIPGLTQVPYESTMANGALHTENAAITASSDVVSSLAMPTYEVAKVLTLSGNLEQTSIAAFNDWVESNLFRSVLYQCDTLAVAGTGSSQPKGINALTYVDGTNAVAWAGASLAYADLAEAVSLLPSLYDNSAVWIMNKKTYWQGVRGLALGSTYDQVVESGKLLGYRVVFDDFVADNVIYFGSIRDGLKINMPGGIQVEQGRYLRTNSYDFLGVGYFACNVIPNAFIKVAASI